MIIDKNMRLSTKSQKNVTNWVIGIYSVQYQRYIVLQNISDSSSLNLQYYEYC